MRSVFIILFLCSILELTLSSETVTVTVQRIRPKGFRIEAKRFHQKALRRVFQTSEGLLKNKKNTYLIFNVNINKPLEEKANADFIARITAESGAEEWTYDNLNIRIENGWKIEYRIEFQYKPPMGTRALGVSLSEEGSAEFSESSIDITPYFKDENCQPSLTTVRGQSVCKGKLVFEEHFHTLNPKIWKIDARIPWDTQEYPFVSFQNDPEIVYTDKSLLNINTKFLWKTPGFSESKLKTGTLRIRRCLGLRKECVRKATFSQILPPIISGRIQTKHSFSFRYGKIVIRAKMPKGDWIVPMLYLEPLENLYGSSNYASGQIRIASVRGNRVLQTLSNGKDISNRYLSGGVVLENFESLQDVCMRHYDSEEYVSDDFHNFTLTWTDKSITLGIDDHVYGSIEGGFAELLSYQNSNAWDSESIMTPFDREFYFTIGLSVGGHTDFPDFCKSGRDYAMKPWKNTDPKAMLHFWNDRENWMDSWKNHSNLQVDFILVYAL